MRPTQKPYALAFKEDVTRTWYGDGKKTVETTTSVRFVGGKFAPKDLLIDHLSSLGFEVTFEVDSAITTRIIGTKRERVLGDGGTDDKGV